MTMKNIKNPNIMDADIMSRERMLTPDDCELLVNLWFETKQWLGLDTAFNLRQLRQGIESNPDAFGRIMQLIDCVRLDMMHWPDNPATRPRNVKLRRILPGDWIVPGEVPTSVVEARYEAESRRERDFNRTRWAVFLNDGIKGGKYCFPTRKREIAPETGLGIRWPGCIPWSLEHPMPEPMFLLTGESDSNPGAKGENWPARDEDYSGIMRVQ